MHLNEDWQEDVWRESSKERRVLRFVSELLLSSSAALALAWTITHSGPYDSSDGGMALARFSFLTIGLLLLVGVVSNCMFRRAELYRRYTTFDFIISALEHEIVTGQPRTINFPPHRGARISDEIRTDVARPLTPPIEVPRKSTAVFAVSAGTGAIAASAVASILRDESSTPRWLFYCAVAVGLIGALSVTLGATLSVDRTLKLQVIRLIIARAKDLLSLDPKARLVETGSAISEQREILVASGDSSEADALGSLLESGDKADRSRST